MSGLIRLLLLGLLGWFVWRRIRPHLPGSAPRANADQPPNVNRMVRCAVCGAYVDERLTRPRDGQPVCLDHHDSHAA